MTQAAESVAAIIAHPIIPCTLEFLDRVTLHCVESYAHIGLPLDAEAILIIETDGHPAVVEEEIGIMERLLRQHGARSVQTAADDAEAARLIAARRVAFSALARLAPTIILEDITVPRSRLPEMIDQIQSIGERHRVRIGTFGHMGDGNLHPTFLTDERNPTEMARVDQAMAEIFTAAIGLGGTITGEHGVGLAKKPFLEDGVGSASLHLMRQLKQTLDPANLLNPGKIFDPLPVRPMPRS